MSVNHSIKHVAGIAIAAALYGCATGPAFKAPESAPADRAQLYVYRPLVMAGGGVAHKITIDGSAETLSLPNASWQRVLLAAGTHTVSIKDYFNIMPCGGVSIDLAQGQTAYLANVVKTTQGLGALYVGCGVIEKPEEEALKDMVGLNGAQ